MSEAELRRILGAMVASATTTNKTSAAISAVCPARMHHLVAEVPFSSTRKWSAVAFDDGPADMAAPPADHDAAHSAEAAEPLLRGIYALGAPEVLAPYLDGVTRPG